MIDHVSLGVRDLAASAAFYEHVLAPLGLTRLVEREKSVGFGKAYPEIWIHARPGLARAGDDGLHVCLRVRAEAAVVAFHEAAVAAGGESAGAPGPRQAAQTPYFAAFVYDLDGHKLEAACFPAAI